MIEINLLPVREERRKADLHQQLVLLVGTLLAAVLLAAATHWWVAARQSSAKGRVAHLEKQIEKHAEQLAQVEAYRATKLEIQKKLAVIDRLDASRSGPVRVLDELSIHTPDRLWITDLETNKGKVSIEGMSLDNELVAIFITSLNDSSYFSDVELEETELLERDRLKLNQFRLKARLTTPGLDDPATTAEIASASGRGR